MSIHSEESRLAAVPTNAALQFAFLSNFYINRASVAKDSDSECTIVNHDRHLEEYTPLKG